MSLHLHRRGQSGLSLVGTGRGARSGRRLALRVHEPLPFFEDSALVKVVHLR